MFKDRDGKTEAPTPQRLSQAANKGQVAISREFTAALSLMFATLALYWFGDGLFGALAEVLEKGMTVDPAAHAISDGGIDGAVREVEDQLYTILVPWISFLLVFFAVTALAGYGQIGFKFRWGALKVSLDKLNPANNVKRLISFQSVARTAVSALKLVILGAVLWYVLQGRIERFAALYDGAELRDAIDLIVETAFLIVMWICATILAISVIDLVYQRWDFHENMKMTKQEVEDERKRSDGDPFIKGRLRQARRELMQQRMMEALKEADVVITNPTHFSVALAYDRTKHAAPRVVAKGVDEIALRIREIAEEHDVPRVEDPPLARALYRAVKIGHEIPERFYQAVATILGHVFRQRGQVA